MSETPAHNPWDAAAARPASGAEAAPPLETRARVAIAFLALTVLGAALSLWADLQQVDLLGRVVDGERVRLRDAEDSDDRVAWTAAVYTVGFITAVVTFLLWYSRAYRNAIKLGFAYRYGTGWAIGYWFIPIVNLFRPKQVMNDIWRGSKPDGPERDERVSPLLHWWWALWLISSVVDNLAFRVGFEDGDFVTSPRKLLDQANAYVAADVFDMIAGVLAILVVRRLTARLEARRALALSAPAR